MPIFNVTCRALFERRTIDALDAKGIYWFKGAPTLLSSNRRRHHLRIDARDGEEALRLARTEIEAAGGEADELTLVGESGEQELN